MDMPCTYVCITPECNGKINPLFTHPGSTWLWKGADGEGSLLGKGW